MPTLLFLIAAAAASPAPAAGPPGVALLPVQSEGQVQPADLRRVGESVVRGLRAAGFQVVGIDQAQAAAGKQGLTGCTEGACLREFGRAAGVSHVARVSVVSKHELYSAEVAVLAAADGHEIAREIITCGTADLCAPLPETAADAARAAGRKAIGEIEAASAVAIVAAPIAAPAPALAASPITPAKQPILSHPRLVPWIAIGCGVALVATSAVMFAYDGKKTAGDQHYENTTPAVVTGLTGLAALAVGAYLWPPNPNGAVALAVTPSGIVASGRF